MGVRLKKLCDLLNMSDELRLKIWTLFECSLNNCTFLMEDRHLDQLLLCAVFVIVRVRIYLFIFLLLSVETFPGKPSILEVAAPEVAVTQFTFTAYSNHGSYSD